MMPGFSMLKGNGEEVGGRGGGALALVALINARRLSWGGGLGAGVEL